MKNSLPSFVLAILVANAVSHQAGAQQEERYCERGDDFVLPRGQVLWIQEDLFIDVRCSIDIAGAIIAAPDSGASILLQAGLMLHASGYLEAGDGKAGDDAAGRSGTVQGGHGARGGAIALVGGVRAGACRQLESCATHPVTVASTFVAQPGNGGNGGRALVEGALTEEELSELDCRCAVGGNGGAAGMVFIATAVGTPAFDGVLLPVEAGAGGASFAEGPFAVARGGQGGVAGPVYLSDGSPENLLRLNANSLPGAGGPAMAGASCDGAAVIGCDGDAASDPCETDTLLTDTPLLSRLFENSDGPPASATGGAGGVGIVEGGRGGNAAAAGCSATGEGGPGARGNDATWVHYCYPETGYCNPLFVPPTNGGTGGSGPSGGTGTALGGKGGDALLLGGKGGGAEANGGQGGRGGPGGDGGNNNTMPCVDGGDAGDGGTGGAGGWTVATGGSGGNAHLAMGKGGEGVLGAGTPGAGGPGGVGGNGGDPFFLEPGEFVSCGGDRGRQGFPGGQGATGEIQHEWGANGDSGEKDPRELVDYITDLACSFPWITCPEGPPVAAIRATTQPRDA